MQSLKTYQKVNSKDQKVTFAISKMEDIYDKRGGATDEPHRHHFFTVIVVEQAKGIHKVDFNTYQLDNHQIYFVSPGQVHQVIEEKKSIGFSMTFSTQFLVANGIHLSFIESLNLFHDYGQCPPLSLSKDQFQKIASLIKEIILLFKSDVSMKNLSIGAYLKLILIECNYICSTNPVETTNEKTENKIIRSFKVLVNKNYKTQHSTTFYADALHISADHLNRTIKSTIGKTAKEYIQSRITTEAKRLLFFSDLSNKEIGFELGFNEPAYFSAFFKKCTGYSPSNFLEQEKH